MWWAGNDVVDAARESIQKETMVPWWELGEDLLVEWGIILVLGTTTLGFRTAAFITLIASTYFAFTPDVGSDASFSLKLKQCLIGVIIFRMMIHYYSR